MAIVGLSGKKAERNAVALQTLKVESMTLKSMVNLMTKLPKEKIGDKWYQPVEVENDVDFDCSACNNFNGCAFWSETKCLLDEDLCTKDYRLGNIDVYFIETNDKEGA